ncbi:MAG: CapA family protein, partial [Clostridia bacterium]|nr:CapA family protein [Clostridia bacterium]
MKKYKVLAAFVLAMLFLLICGCALLVPEETPSNTSSASDVLEQSNGASSSQAGTDTSLPAENSKEESDISSGEIIVIPIPEDTVISFLACGDNLIHPSVYFNAMRNYAEANGITCDYNATEESGYDFLPTYEYVADRMKNADICYINQETLSGGPGTEINGYPKFNTPSAMGRDLAALGVDIVNMAHNHMLDAGNDSLLKYSDEYFKSLGMTPLGYYKDEADTDNIVIYEEQGVKIALLTYTYSTNGIPCYSETYIPYF